jgi:cytoskeletal protein CcmA (bactofilin family)
MTKNIATAVTSISEGTQIIGDLKVEHDLRVDGYLKGSVHVGGALVLTPTGRIEGEVVVRSAIIAGQIHGNVKGMERIVLEGKSTLVGDLQTRELVINEGAIFQGNCSMKQTDGKA